MPLQFILFRQLGLQQAYRSGEEYNAEKENYMSSNKKNRRVITRFSFCVNSNDISI
jgi:hypothetical protein